MTDETWVPYRPPWYPNKDPFHNPLASNGETGSAECCWYEQWRQSLKPGELEQLIADHHRQVKEDAPPF